jgi:cysteinyl-tRNA synthetase
MSLRIHNTLSRTKEAFAPRTPGRVSMYVCGVTPYAPAHAGHGRHAVVFDVVRRWLTHRGYDVTYVMNVTDIEDKIIAAAQAEGRSWRELADQYTASYWAELSELGVSPPTVAPKASEHVDDIIGLVQRLVDGGYAYVLDGDVVFHVPSFPKYGELSRRDLDSQIVGARVEPDRRKKDARDFFVWKGAKPGEPSWESPWGPGRPGWHIECSAMSAKYLGAGFDIHGGGADLIFPHHENEIAQSEAGRGSPFARIWMHNGTLNMARDDSAEGEKMSKSLGNVVPLREALDRIGGPALRYFCIAAHYRSDVPYGDRALQQAESALERLQIGVQNIDRLLGGPTREAGAGMAELEEARASAESQFYEAMDDDFGTSRALAALHGVVGAVNRAGAGASATFAPSEEGRARLIAARQTLVGLAGVLGLSLEEAKGEAGLTARLVEILAAVRQKARESGQYEIADEIRTRLAELGVALEDRAEGTTWRMRRSG